jgi:hypothetical protein
VTPPDDRTLEQLRRAFAAVDASIGAPAACPSADHIWMAVCGELSHSETSAVVLHTAACAWCAEAWRLAHAASRDRPRAAAAVPAWRSVWVWGPGLAAAALLVLGVLSERPPRAADPGGPAQYRESPEGVIEPLIADGAIVSRDALLLRWKPGPEGSRYNVRVMTADLTPVATAGSIAATEYAVPAAALEKVPSGARLLWQIDTLSPDAPRRTSPTFIVQLQ